MGCPSDDELARWLGSGARHDDDGLGPLEIQRSRDRLANEVGAELADHTAARLHGQAERRQLMERELCEASGDLALMAARRACLADQQAELEATLEGLGRSAGVTRSRKTALSWPRSGIAPARDITFFRPRLVSCRKYGGPKKSCALSRPRRRAPV